MPKFTLCNVKVEYADRYGLAIIELQSVCSWPDPEVREELLKSAGRDPKRPLLSDGSG